MPVILARTALDTMHHLNVAKRQRGEEQDSAKYMSPATIGFLVPLFVVFIFGPFLCIYFVRNRRTARIQHRLNSTPPALRRKEARKMLEGLAAVSIISKDDKHKCMASVDERSTANRVSVTDDDCAICLSTLHAPSHPEPAKVVETTGTAKVLERLPPSRTPSISEQSIAEKEGISKLEVCGHEFHAECLISWFLVRKYSCPICRAVYFAPAEEKRKSQDRLREGTQTSSQSHRNEQHELRQREDV
ncbi:hypothetical protein CC78DRAFT_575839 [Lojkania enalia]|uniref:RING-type domain-containing protein n=1 Tax=Lojkania enalia TaxID=147567 RepID=A0A9P4KJN8_9PLEO|nr:hypothetical protein CC78DRAFT_575839 [Didymosphaeria enalia]